MLIVDDDLFIVKFLKKYFTHAGYNVFTAENGQQALEQIQKVSIDIIILDTMMPVMDGFQFLHQLRHTLHSMIPVISLTAMETQNSEADLLNAGASTVLFKPINHEVLSDTVSNIVDFLN